MGILKRLKFFILALAVIIALSIALLLWRPFSTGYFSSCAITYDQYDHPLITVELQGHLYKLELRAGSKFPLFLSKKMLDCLDKQPQGTTQWHDLNGKQHDALSYLIPKMKIGNLTLTNVPANQSPEEETGILGKYLGGEFNLLLDFPHSLVIACDTFLKLQTKKLTSNHWVRVPFESNCGSIILHVNTEMGALKLAINTTSTFSFIRAPLISSEKDSVFSIGEQEFGSITFHPLDMPEGLSEIDGFIGMDFLKKHAFYIDYSNKIAYIEPPPIYFERFPITFGDRGLPIINISIEGTTYSLEFDLGSSFPVSLNEKILKTIHKISYGTAYWSDFRGTRYESPAYTIPEIKIGNLILADVFSKQNNEDFHINVSFDALVSQPPGAIGHPILEKYNLFLDLPHSAIYASNSYLPLQQAGLLSKNLLVIPFVLHPDGILLICKTDEGIQRLLLDTGATHTVIRAPHPTSSSQFCLMGHDFGAHSIIPIDLCSRFDYEGFLGLDFLKKHSLFIDYPHKLIYLDLQEVKFQETKTP